LKTKPKKHVFLSIQKLTKENQEKLREDIEAIETKFKVISEIVNNNND
jgi:hypothetical protein|tara:strand:- start:46 stop:189 length:144 start_codon:yes stop_codon:yes gene_type:complete